MKTYARELVARLPRVAPEYAYVPFTRGRQLRLGRAGRASAGDAARAARSRALPVAVRAGARCRARFVITIHDLIHLRFPQYFKAKVGPYYATVVRLACARAAARHHRRRAHGRRSRDVSGRRPRESPRHSARRRRAFSRPVRRIAARARICSTSAITAQHKDLPTLFDAWSALPERLEVDLYLTGPDDFGGELQRRSGAARAIVALGDVGDERLAAYYAGARRSCSRRCARASGCRCSRRWPPAAPWSRATTPCRGR